MPKNNMLNKRKKRHRRIRGKVKGTSQRPRLFVFRSNQHIYAQLIDDQKEKTLLSLSDLDLKSSQKSKKEKASEVGKLMAEEALKKKIKKVVFDRGGYKYHGRVKALAEGAREKGLEF